jgi:hypothetical protein
MIVHNFHLFSFFSLLSGNAIQKYFEVYLGVYYGGNHRLGRFPSNYHSNYTSYCQQTSRCSWFHIPPMLIEGPWEHYDNFSLRFCTVRNPYLRIISEIEFEHHRGCYSQSSLEKVIRERLEAEFENVVSGRCIDARFDCHFLPQWMHVEPHATPQWMDMVWQKLEERPNESCAHILKELESTIPSRGRGCNFVLKMEDLNNEMTRFMRRCVAFSVEKHPLLHTNRSCKHTAPLPADIMNMIQIIYEKDFEMFNYQK